jgi:selenocysteine lyase/cysteine desulfurase
MTAVRDIPKVKLYTSMKPGYACAIGVVNIDGKKPGELDNYLFSEYRVHVTNLTWEKIQGVRVTPNVYTTTKDLDKLIAGIEAFAKA